VRINAPSFNFHTSNLTKTYNEFVYTSFIPWNPNCTKQYKKKEMRMKETIYGEARRREERA
jgi:hypothetical protein